MKEEHYSFLFLQTYTHIYTLSHTWLDNDKILEGAIASGIHTLREDCGFFKGLCLRWRLKGTPALFVILTFNKENVFVYNWYNSNQKSFLKHNYLLYFE